MSWEDTDLWRVNPQPLSSSKNQKAVRAMGSPSRTLFKQGFWPCFFLPEFLTNPVPLKFHTKKAPQWEPFKLRRMQI